MKKTGLLIALVIASILMTFYQIQYIEKEALQASTEVYMMKEDRVAGHIIETTDLVLGSIYEKWASDDYITDMNQVVGKTLDADVKKNTVVTSRLLRENQSELLTSKTNQAITALKLLPEEALCWEVNPNEWVSLYFISGEGQLESMGQVYIKEAYDDYNQPVKEKGYTTYLLIEGDKSIIEGIIQNREKGRFEIVKTSQNS